MNLRRDICLALLIAMLALGLYLSGQLILSAAGPLTGYQRLDGLLGLAASITGGVLVAWWIAALALAVISETLHRVGLHRPARAAGALAPPFMKRLAVSVLGLQLAVGVPPSASALPTTSPWVSPPGTAVSGGTAGWSSMLTSGPLNPSEDGPAPEPQWKPLPGPVDGSVLLREGNRSTAGTEAPSAGVVEVAPGDSLWTIAARHLGPFATDVEIAQAWPRWHQENRQVIGNDPHLLRPGQILRAPSDHS